MKTTRNRMKGLLLVGLTAALVGANIFSAYGQARGEANGDAGSCRTLEGEEQAAFLKAHNDARAERGVEPLTWSNDIATYALAWLNQSKQSYQDAWRNGQPLMLKHRPDRKYGENLACWFGSGGVSNQAMDAVAIWLGEKPAFDKLNSDPRNPYFIRGTEVSSGPDCVIHYTQIVWKNTKRIGAAKYIDTYLDKNHVRQTMVVIICNYDPPGNILGQKPF